MSTVLPVGEEAKAAGPAHRYVTRVNSAPLQ